MLIPAKDSGLPRDSVANATQFVTIDRDFLEDRTGKVPARILARIEAGLRLVLDL